MGGCWAVGLVGCAAVYGPVVPIGWLWIAGLYLTQETGPALYVYVYKLELYLIFSQKKLGIPGNTQASL